MQQPSAEVLKEAYQRGKDHGFNGYYRGEIGDWMEAAYDIGWEDGAQITEVYQLKRDILDRIVSRFRAMHGVYE